jgi:uncharacterized membrane protein
MNILGNLKKEVQKMRRNMALVLALAFVLFFAVQVSAEGMKGKVKAIDDLAKTITVGNFVFETGNIDLSGINVGNTVRITYEVKGEKKILKSIVKERITWEKPVEGEGW